MGWDFNTFFQKTGLDKHIYYQIMGGYENPNHNRPNGGTARITKVTLRIVISFCVGICADMDTVNALLSAAKLAFGEGDFYYRYCVNDMHGYTLDECNYLLELNGLELLGSKAYKPRKVVSE